MRCALFLFIYTFTETSIIFFVCTVPVFIIRRYKFRTHLLYFPVCVCQSMYSIPSHKHSLKRLYNIFILTLRYYTGCSGSIYNILEMGQNKMEITNVLQKRFVYQMSAVLYFLPNNCSLKFFSRYV